MNRAISVSGTGWLTGDRYGALKRQTSDGYADVRSLHTRLRQESVLPYPLEAWGRFDDISRLTCLAAGLALFDSGTTCSREQKQDMGIVGTNANASLQSNISYFKDYIENGRTLARGNLFIYTIPSSPLAEAAIYFGLAGPLFYVSSARRGVVELLDCAAHLIAGQDTAAVLAVRAEETEAVAFVLAAEERPAGGAICGLTEAQELLRTAGDVREIVAMLARVNR